MYAASRQQVTDVWVAGKQLLKSPITDLDEKELLNKAQNWRNKIKIRYNARVCSPDEMFFILIRCQNQLHLIPDEIKNISSSGLQKPFSIEENNMSTERTYPSSNPTPLQKRDRTNYQPLEKADYALQPQNDAFI